MTNNGDRPIQVGSHYHFIETNPKLAFDRALAYGKRLDIPAGTSVRFEPGETSLVTLVEIGGDKIISGGNSLASGPVLLSRIDTIVNALMDAGFSHIPESRVAVTADVSQFQMDRRRYADAYGPTVGDRVRLSDSHLWLEIEKDYTVYGDECVFGGGKVIREGMGQCTGVYDKDALDLVITNAIIVDYTGIVKVKDGGGGEVAG